MHVRWCNTAVGRPSWGTLRTAKRNSQKGSIHYILIPQQPAPLNCLMLYASLCLQLYNNSHLINWYMKCPWIITCTWCPGARSSSALFSFSKSIEFGDRLPQIFGMFPSKIKLLHFSSPAPYPPFCSWPIDDSVLSQSLFFCSEQQHAGSQCTIRHYADSVVHSCTCTDSIEWADRGRFNACSIDKAIDSSGWTSVVRYESRSWCDITYGSRFRRGSRRLSA